MIITRKEGNNRTTFKDRVLDVLVRFGSLYMRNPDDKHLTGKKFEPTTSEFLATTRPNVGETGASKNTGLVETHEIRR